MGKLKINQEAFDSDKAKVTKVIEEYKVHRDTVTQYILDNKEEFSGETSSAFRENLIRVNITTSNILCLLEQYLSSFTDYCDLIENNDVTLSKIIKEM